MKFSPDMFSKMKMAMIASILLLNCAAAVRAQEPMMGQQNGITWKKLVIGTPAETLTRKTFYIDGLDNMSAFWSQHADLKPDAIDFNRIFVGMSVGQIRDGLDSFYVDEKNLQVPIIDAILVLQMHNHHVDAKTIEDILSQFREATINGPNPTRENKIWQEALKLIK